MDTTSPGQCQCPVAQVTGGLIGLSEERTSYLRRILEAEQAAELRGYERGVATGYAQCAADVKAAQHAIYDHLAREAETDRLRWTVRHLARTRQTFGQPHPGDYVPAGNTKGVAA